MPREAFTDELGKELWDTCGKEEMGSSGAAWLKRFKMERETVSTILSDFRGADRKAINNPAAWLQEAWNQSGAGERERARKSKKSGSQ